MSESLQLRVHGAEAAPTLIYLPGLHGDWTLLGPFRAALAGKARLVETTYPRRPEWTLDDYAAALETALLERGIGRVWLLAESFSSQVAWQLLGRRGSLDGAERGTSGQCHRSGAAVPAVTTGVSPAKINAGETPAEAGQRPAPLTNAGGTPAETGETSASLPVPSRVGSATMHLAERMEVAGLILVGGFVKHPWPWGVRVAHGASRAVPLWLLKRLCALYGRSASRRCCAAPEVAAEIEEFVRRRTFPADREAVTSRYRLIAGSDPRAVARRARLPVYHLSGAIDPLVPWWHVAAWLKRDCPGFRASRIVRRAGHNVLLDAPGESVKQILEWID